MSVVGGLAGSGRVLRLDPYSLPVRYAAQDGGADGMVRQIDLDRERVVLRRAVSGIPMKVGVQMRDFRGVSIRVLPPQGEEPAVSAVMLEHHDAALSVPLLVTPDGDEVMASWKSWARVLGLPLLVADDDGALREPFKRLGRLAIGKVVPRRRRRGALQARRPLIMLRRKPGRQTTEANVHRNEREIIARN